MADPFDSLGIGSVGEQQQQQQQVPPGMTPPPSFGGGYTPQASPPIVWPVSRGPRQQVPMSLNFISYSQHNKLELDATTKFPPHMKSFMPPDPHLQSGNQPPMTFTQPGLTADAQIYFSGQSFAASGIMAIPMGVGNSDTLPFSSTNVGDAELSKRQNDQASGVQASVPQPPSPERVPRHTGNVRGMAIDQNGEGAKWVPPVEQLSLYQSMFASASAASTIPGTVSGRAAVQFFSRSGLPKDTLKTIWSLCDPELTGCIREPGFFAAMRLIALAQVSPVPSGSAQPLHASPQPPSLAALEATRYAPLPPPRLEGFASPRAIPTSETTLPAAVPVATPSTPLARGIPEKSVPQNSEAGKSKGAGAGCSEALQGSASLDKGGSTPLPITPALPRTTAQLDADAEARSEDDADVMLGRRADNGGGDAKKDEHVDEEDFGDFTSADYKSPLSPTTTKQGLFGDGGDGDEFGNFTGADDAAAVKSESLEIMDTPSLTSQAQPPSSEQPKSESSGDWTVAQTGGIDAHGGAALGERTSGGLDDLIESNLQAAISEPRHLASMVTPSLLGKPPPPAMNNASDNRGKLSVFDAMADFDLAVHQEEWNEFADETTAPVMVPNLASPSPPPEVPTYPGAMVEHAVGPSSPVSVASKSTGDIEGKEADNAVKEKSGVGADLFGDMISSGAGRSGSPSGFKTLTPASKPEESSVMEAPDRNLPAEDAENDEDWGEFEEAGDIPSREPHGAKADPAGEVLELETEDNDGEVSLAALEQGSSDTIDVEAPVDDGIRDQGLTPALGDGQPDTSDDVDPFAELSPPGPSLSAPVGISSLGNEVDSVMRADDGEATSPDCVKNGSKGSGEERQGGDPAQGLGAAAPAAEALVDLPFSLRELRDRLAAHGKLEEAAEVQRRMELPVVELSSLQKFAGETKPGQAMESEEAQEPAGNIGRKVTVTSGGVTDERDRVAKEERDLERWRSLLKLPPIPTLDDMAQDAESNATDACRLERFRERFIKGRPPVEEEALAGGGGGRALENALRRQRAARRALLLSRILCADPGEKGGVADVASGEIDKGATTVEDLLLDMGGSEAGRSPPTLSDWAIMVSFVTRMVQAGLDALRPEDSSPNVAAGANELTEKKTGTMNPEGNTEDGSADFRPIPRPGTKPTADFVAREVAKSSKFAAFSQGLREAVHVCRLFEAAAQDGLETVDGFEKLEKTWEAFRKRWDEIQSRTQTGDDPAARSELTKGRSAGMADPELDVAGFVDNVELPSVESIREASLKAPPDSPYCTVCLQPLGVFGSPACSAVVDYCGVRYLTRAVNLWVNVLDKAPPRLGELSASREDSAVSWMLS